MIFKKKEKSNVAKYSKFDKKNFLFVYLLILLPVLQFIIFWFVVNVNSIALAFQKDGSFSFENFKNVWINFVRPDSTGGVPMMLARSLILWSVSNLVAFPIALFTTYVLYRRVIGHYAFRVIFSIAGIVGAVVWVTMLKGILQPATSGGIVMHIFQNWFGVKFDAKAMQDGLLGSPNTLFPTILLIGFISGIVGGNVIVTGAYAKVPPELMEASKLDGLDFWGSFIHVVLPCSWPTISTLLTISLCGILVADANVFLYTNGTGGTNQCAATMGYYLYTLSLNISENPTTADYGFPAAMGVTISLISIPLVLLGRRIITKVIPTVEV